MDDTGLIFESNEINQATLRDNSNKHHFLDIGINRLFNTLNGTENFSNLSKDKLEMLIKTINLLIRNVESVPNYVFKFEDRQDKEFVGSIYSDSDENEAVRLELTARRFDNNEILIYLNELTCIFRLLWGLKDMDYLEGYFFQNTNEKFKSLNSLRAHLDEFISDSLNTKNILATIKYSNECLNNFYYDFIRKLNKSSYNRNRLEALVNTIKIDFYDTRDLPVTRFRF